MLKNILRLNSHQILTPTRINNTSLVRRTKVNINIKVPQKNGIYPATTVLANTNPLFREGNAHFNLNVHWNAKCYSTINKDKNSGKSRAIEPNQYRKRNSFSREEIEYSLLEESTFEECLNALNEWYASLPQNDISFDYSTVPRITKEELENEIDKKTIIILARLKKSKELVGCTAVGKPEISKGNIPSSYLSHNAIKTEYRKRGLSHLLLEESMKIAEKMGAKKVYALVVSDLTFLINFLFKQGFEQMDITTKHKSELPYHHSKHMRESITLYNLEKKYKPKLRI